MFVYHTNPGFPVLDADARVVLNSSKTTEWLEDREVGPETYTTAPPPRKNAHDDVYIHRPIPDEHGTVHVGLINDRLGLGLYWKFPFKEMPVITHWAALPPGHLRHRHRARQRQHARPRLEPPARLPETHPAR